MMLAPRLARARWPLLLLLPAVAWTYPAQARYARPDLVEIPVARLTKNLEKLARENPDDVTVRFNLARAHAMAYALKTDSATVRRGHEDEGAWFGYEPEHVPFQVAPTEDVDALEAAKKHLEQAIAAYTQVLELDPNHLSAALGHAWCLEQAEDPGAVAAYRRVVELAWKSEKDLQMADLGWHSVTAEAAGYLIPLLDAEKDAKEIATLNDRIERMLQVPRPITPIVVPLREGLSVYDLEDRAASVPFDADGTGLAKRWTWITPNAGWLVSDPRGTGKITSSLQLFGGVTFWMFWEHGYQALAALDNDGDRMLAGPELRGLAIWQDRDSNGVCDEGEVQPLSAWGIASISCRCERDTAHPDGIVFSPQGVVLTDGTTRPTYDIVLRPR
jgi:tetratricopeptide (TPR) repeat protein